MLILHVFICISLMWGAIEKWAYRIGLSTLLADARTYVRPLCRGLDDSGRLCLEFAFAYCILDRIWTASACHPGIGYDLCPAILDFGKIDESGHFPSDRNGWDVPTWAAQLNLRFHDNSDGIFRRARTAGIAFATTVFHLLCCVLWTAIREISGIGHTVKGLGVGAIANALSAWV